MEAEMKLKTRVKAGASTSDIENLQGDLKLK